MQLKNILPPLLITVILLIVLEILTTTLLPLFGLEGYRIPFNVLLILFVGFKLDTPYLPVIILSLQYTHSFFSVEGWEMGTIAGIIICVVISYLRDVLHFNSKGITILVTQLFQVMWFIIVSGLLYIKTDNLPYIVDKFWRFVPESIVVSLLAPFFFALLDKVWRVKEESMINESV